MNQVVSRYVSSGVLMVWGVVLTYFVVSGRVGSYLHPAFHAWTAVSGGVLILMAGGLLFLPSGEVECCDHGPGGLSRFGWIPALILTVPFLVAVVVSPSQFGAAAVTNRGMIESIDDLPGYQPYVEPPLPTEDGSVGPTQTLPSSDYLPRNAAGQITAQTVDLLYAAQEPAMREDFEGKEVELIGQFMPAKENNAAGDRFNLVRMYVMCCAADARPVAVTVQSDAPEKPAEMSWVKVTGVATFPVEGGRRTPVVVAKAVEPCDPPDESFIY